MIGAVVAASLLTPALFFLSPSSFANFFRALPTLSAVIGGGLAVALLGRELHFIVQKAWRVRESSKVGAGPFRAMPSEVVVTRVPRRLVAVWFVHGCAALGLAVFGGLRLPFLDEFDSIEAAIAWEQLVSALSWLAACGMWITGWSLLMRWHGARPTAWFCFAFLSLFAVAHTALSLATWHHWSSVVIAAWLAGAWMLYEATRMARLTGPASR